MPIDKRITYLFGAGASFHSMPLLDTLPERMTLYRDFVYHQMKEPDWKAIQGLKKYVDDLDELLHETDASTSIDNYAKSLYLSGDLASQQRLRNLKSQLSHYLIFEQLYKSNQIFRRMDFEEVAAIPAVHRSYPTDLQKKVHTQFDKRYRTFFNDCIDVGTKRFPRNLNIISWNYDLQMEGTYCSTYHVSLELAQQNLNIYPSNNHSQNINASQIIKLNGTAGIDYSTANTTSFTNFFTDFRYSYKAILLTAISIYLQHRAINQSQVLPSLTFAFEESFVSQQARELASNILAETDILIIVGYSFPKMNEKVDREVFAKATELEQVIFQTQTRDYLRTKDRLKKVCLIGSDEIIELDDHLLEFRTV